MMPNLLKNFLNPETVWEVFLSHDLADAEVGRGRGGETSYHVTTVADPGFPRGGGANPKGGAPTYYLANFSSKLHEN